jgi:hypothetical protein
MDAVHEDVAQLLRSPATVRTFRAMMWGYLFFLPLVGTYFDALGWLILLLAAQGMDAVWPARRALLSITAVGLVVAAVRIVVFISRAVSTPVFFTVLSTASLALAAAYLWQVSAFAAVLAEEAGSRAVAAQAAQRRWLYALYVVLLPAAFACAPLATAWPGEVAIAGGYMLAGVIITTLVLALLANVAKMCIAAASADAAASAEAAAAAPDDEGRSAT